MDEAEHVIAVLTEARDALTSEDAPKLRELSNQTIHCASYIQDSGSITLAVVMYSLSKIIERSDHERLKNWSSFVKKCLSWMQLAIRALQENNQQAYEKYLGEARRSLMTVSPNLRLYIQDVLRKASINKASRIYEHGVSLGKTAQLLGVTQWELAEYAGQKKAEEQGYHTFDIKKRAAMALEFFA